MSDSVERFAEVQYYDMDRMAAQPTSQWHGVQQLDKVHWLWSQLGGMRVGL